MTEIDLRNPARLPLKDLPQEFEWALLEAEMKGAGEIQLYDDDEGWQDTDPIGAMLPNFAYRLKPQTNE